MNRESVRSSNLRSVGYDGWTGTLEIEFRSGGVYRYSNVPGERYERLMRASSKGGFFCYYIKYRFACRKVR